MTDLTLAEQRTLAWQTLPCRTTTCLQPAGRRCITSSGERTSPHAPRIYDIRAYLLGQATAQAENAALTALNTSLRASNDQLVAALKTSDDKLDMAVQRITNLTADLADANARIAELETPPTPEPTKQRTQFGACVLTTAAAVPTKFGAGASIRIFYDQPAGSLPWPTAPAGSLLHVSYKMYGKTYTDAQIDAMLTKARGHLVTVNHEPDNGDVTDAKIPDMVAVMNRVYDRNVALGRPAKIAPTFTGDFWSNHTTDGERDTWLKDLKGDLFGLDFDGVHDNQTTKPADLTYRVGKTEVTNADEIAALQRAMAKYGVPGFCVPEFGTSRAAWDTDGLGRTKWINDNAARFVAAGAYYVAWYDQSANGKTDVVAAGSPELAALRALVAAN